MTNSRFRKWTLRFLSIVAVLLVMLSGAGLWFYFASRSALPQLDGSISLAGISQTVSVIRDAHGVPTIESASLEDLFFAQGYITAQDRLWQMDFMRRLAAGEIAEVMGSGFVNYDREQRILGLRTVAEHVANSEFKDRKYFEAYARGVNAFIDSHRGQLPVEFRILHYLPKEWRVADSMLLGTLLAQDLNHGSYRKALVREKILTQLGPELAADLYVNSSGLDRPPERQSVHAENKKMVPDGDSQQPAAKEKPKSNPTIADLHNNTPFAHNFVLTPGSNSWVVSGAHTISGKPLLSNDIHLRHQLPNLWYEIHLRAGSFDVAGITLPGLPFVIAGHNQHIAWGLTSLTPTVEDLYVETFNDKGDYLTPTGWRPPEHRQEVIMVRGGTEVTVDVALTRHGPIITDVVTGETRKLALHWTLFDSFHDPFFDLNMAENWPEFRQALSSLDSPPLCVIYADIDGHIGFQATGHIPVRKTGDGSLPLDGATDRDGWTGFVPFDQLPSVYDPPSGILASANDRITPDGYPYSLSAEWGSPWRVHRIYDVLESGRKFSLVDMLALQTDVYSNFDKLCAQNFVNALDHVSNLSNRAEQAKELMRNWDGRLSADSAAATIEGYAQYELARLLLEPKLTAPAKSDAQGNSATQVVWTDYNWSMSSIWLEKVLTDRPRSWLPPMYGNYDELLAAAVESAVKASDAPKDLSHWQWGIAAPVQINHPIFGKVPFLNHWTGPGLHPQSGGSYTVKQVGPWFGPSERMTVDLANLDNSTLNLVTGQSGHLLSPYYMDQWNAWYQGSTINFPFSQQAIERNLAHRLKLEPLQTTTANYSRLQ